MVGDWNENRGGASRTERGETPGSPATSVREFLTGAGRLENQTKWARFQRLVREIYFSFAGTNFESIDLMKSTTARFSASLSLNMRLSL